MPRCCATSSSTGQPLPHASEVRFVAPWRWLCRHRARPCAMPVVLTLRHYRWQPHLHSDRTLRFSSSVPLSRSRQFTTINIVKYKLQNAFQCFHFQASAVSTVLYCLAQLAVRPYNENVNAQLSLQSTISFSSPRWSMDTIEDTIEALASAATSRSFDLTALPCVSTPKA